MSDPLRSETSRTTEPASRADREAKIEQLLLAGLDHYFAGRYDQAINVWTRALFLDRNHARAHAYIERARTAQAERQRESEALLHDAADAVRRGDGREARRLLDAATARSGASDEVLALLERVERLERSIAVDLPADNAEPPRLALDVSEPPARSAAAWYALGGLVVVIVAAGLFAASAARSDWGVAVERSIVRRTGRAASVPSTVLRDTAALPVVRRAEVSLARAHALVSGGKLHDALALLDTIRPTDPERPDADRLRADIQRQLLALGPVVEPHMASAPDGLPR